MFFDFPHHRGHVPHNLIIPKSDNPQPQCGQRLLPPGIFILLQIVDISIHLNHQRGLMTVKVNDESLNDLLPPKADSQLLRAHFLPKDFLSRRHLTAQFFGALQFFFCDSLTWDDVFDRHGSLILPAFKTNPSPVSPKGEKLKPPQPKCWLGKPTCPSKEKKSTPCPLHLERGKPTRRSVTTLWVRSLFPPPFGFLSVL